MVESGREQEVEIYIARRTDRGVLAPGPDQEAVLGVGDYPVVVAVETAHDATALRETVLALKGRQLQVVVELLEALANRDPHRGRPRWAQQGGEEGDRLASIQAVKRMV
jgi:hypothetical protein